MTFNVFISKHVYAANDSNFSTLVNDTELFHGDQIPDEIEEGINEYIKKLNKIVVENKVEKRSDAMA